MNKQDWENLKSIQSLFPEAEVVMAGNIIQRDQLDKASELFQQSAAAGQWPRLALISLGVG
jgi:hypothetical protein